MEKGLLFLTLSAGCLWLLLDEFYGGQRLSSIAAALTQQGTGSIPWKNDEQAQKQKEANDKKIQDDPNKSQAQKDWEKKNNDHFYGPGPA
jgi:hypothetical protein